MTNEKLDELINQLTYKISVYDQHGLYTDVLNLMIACKAALIEAKKDDWQPIETAPFDTKILAIDDKGEIEVIFKYKFENGDGYWISHSCFNPIHWKPLPNPPKE